MLYNPITGIDEAAAKFAAAKVAYTARVGALATKYNSGQRINAADLTDLIVNFYDPMTIASNELRGLLNGIIAEATRFAGAPDSNDVKAYDCWFGLVVNILCGLPNKAAALEVIDKIRADLTAEATSWFDLASPVIADTSFTAETAIAAYYGQRPVYVGWPDEVAP
jgi:hypothetical protein